MTTVDQIEAAILQLSADDFRRLSEWVQRLDQDHWDEQLAKDVESGKLDALAEEAIRDFKAGKFRTL